MYISWPRLLSAATALFPPTLDSFQSVSTVTYFWFPISAVSFNIPCQIKSFFSGHLTCHLFVNTSRDTSYKLYQREKKSLSERGNKMKIQNCGRVLFREWRTHTQKLPLQTRGSECVQLLMTVCHSVTTLAYTFPPDIQRATCGLWEDLSGVCKLLKLSHEFLFCLHATAKDHLGE